MVNGSMVAAFSWSCSLETFSFYYRYHHSCSMKKVQAAVVYVAVESETAWKAHDSPRDFVTKVEHRCVVSSQHDVRHKP